MDDMRAARPILALVLSSLAALALVAIAGAFPTYRLAGTAGLSAMGGGIAVAVVAMLAGLVPTAVAWERPAVDRIKAMLLTSAIRLGVVLVLMLAVALSGWLETAAFLIWVAIAYLASLAGESVYHAMTPHSSTRNSE
jgi:hypothetical protein